MNNANRFTYRDTVQVAQMTTEMDVSLGPLKVMKMQDIYVVLN